MDGKVDKPDFEELMGLVEGKVDEAKLELLIRDVNAKLV
jgi:hypothetical protein